MKIDHSMEHGTIVNSSLVRLGEEHQCFKHTCIKPLLASRCGVFQNQPPADVHPFSGLFQLRPLNLVKVLITSYQNYSIESKVHTVMHICR